MKHFIHKISITAFTFVLGISSVCLSGLPDQIEMLIARVSPDLIFSASMRACGCGWAQNYELINGRYLSESSSGWCYETQERAQKALLNRISKASKVVKSTFASKNRYEDKGERIELLYFNESGEERAKIIRYDGDTLLLEIDAPNLIIAHEFEAVKTQH